MSLNSLYLVLFFLLPAMAIATTLRHQNHPQHGGLKSMNFRLYQHDFFNKTDYIIVNGVAGLGFTETTGPFGTIIVLQDQLTITSDPSSTVVGTIEGTSIISSFDGLDNILVAKISFNLTQHKGSISVVGVGNTLNPSDIPVVGGTGDFLFVQGYLTTSLVSFKGVAFVYKLEFHLYWPPYAALIKG